MGPVDTLRRVFMAQFWPFDTLGQAYPIDILSLLAMAHHQALLTSSGPLIALIIRPPHLPLCSLKYVQSGPLDTLSHVFYPGPGKYFQHNTPQAYYGVTCLH